jgi:hypothetical protein
MELAKGGLAFVGFISQLATSTDEKAKIAVRALYDL